MGWANYFWRAGQQYSQSFILMEEASYYSYLSLIVRSNLSITCFTHSWTARRPWCCPLELSTYMHAKREHILCKELVLISLTSNLNSIKTFNHFLLLLFVNSILFVRLISYQRIILWSCFENVQKIQKQNRTKKHFLNWKLHMKPFKSLKFHRNTSRPFRRIFLSLLSWRQASQQKL